MKIVLDSEQLKNPYTGLYTFTVELAQAMIKIAQADDELKFYISKEQDKSILGAECKYVKCRFWNKKLPFIYVPGLDIWHTTFQLSRYTGGSFNTKRVITIHDLNFLYENVSPCTYDRLMRKHQERIDRVDHIVAISEFAKNDILKYLDVKGKPVSVVYNGFRIVEYPDYNNPIYRPQKPYIFTIGMINTKKNFKVLPCLLRDNDYELIIAGKFDVITDPDYKDQIIEEAVKYGVEERVHFLGAIEEEDKYWYLKNCDAFAFPSLAEGFGAPVLEAMHFGKPVFLSNLTSLPEIGGTAAYYFENFDPDHMNDVFERSMNDYNHSTSRKDEIVLHSTKFSYDKAAQEYYKIYKEMLRK